MVLLKIASVRSNSSSLRPFHGSALSRIRSRRSLQGKCRHSKSRTYGPSVSSTAILIQRKLGGSVQFEITDQTRDTLALWITMAGLRQDGFLLSGSISARRDARLNSRSLTSRGRNAKSLHSSRRDADWIRCIGKYEGEHIVLLRQ